MVTSCVKFLQNLSVCVPQKKDGWVWVWGWHEHSFLDKLLLSPSSSRMWHFINRSDKPESLLVTGVSSKHTRITTNVTNTPITAPHITRHILDVTRINIRLCYVLIMASQCTALYCFIHHTVSACSSGALVFISCKHFKQMLACKYKSYCFLEKVKGMWEMFIHLK